MTCQNNYNVSFFSTTLIATEIMTTRWAQRNPIWLTWEPNRVFILRVHVHEVCESLRTSAPTNSNDLKVSTYCDEGSLPCTATNSDINSLPPRHNTDHQPPARLLLESTPLNLHSRTPGRLRPLERPSPTFPSRRSTILKATSSTRRRCCRSWSPRTTSKWRVCLLRCSC